MSANNKLTKREIKILRNLLEKVRPIPNIPDELFIPLMSMNVPATTELAIVRNQNLLLTYRDDNFYKGWHFPGSFMSPGDSFENSCRNVAFNEIGLHLKKYTLLSVGAYARDRRFPCVSLFFICSATGTPKCGKWFKIMPKDIIPSHKSLWGIASITARFEQKQFFRKKIKGNYFAYTR